MNKYYIEHACGNFNAPNEYAIKNKDEIIEDILYYIEEGQESPFETIFEFNSKSEAEKEYSKYHDNITVQKNGDRAVVDYHIYRLELEGEGENL